MQVVPGPHPLLTSPDKQVLFKVKIEPFMTNLMDNMHGGWIATTIDDLTSVSILAFDRSKLPRRDVSLDLSISYIKGLTGAEGYCWGLAQVDKIGRSVRYSQCWIYNKKLEICAIGRHTKTAMAGVWDGSESSAIFKPKL